MKNTRLSQTKFKLNTTRCLLSAAAYPMYDYAPDNASLSAVIYGSGDLAYEMLCTFSWAGQMLRIDSDKILNRELTLCAALPAGQNADEICRRLKDEAPMLAALSDLPMDNPKERFTEKDDPNLPYVRYRFRSADVRTLPDLLPGCRYFVVDFPDEADTLCAVRSLADELTRRADRSSFILHTAPQEISGSRNVRIVSLDCDSDELRGWDTLLFKRAFSVHYFYSRSDNPFANREWVISDVLEHMDYLLSSLQAAASTGYKLTSLGIDPCADRETITADYLNCQNRYSAAQIERALIYIEHRRWLIAQALESYRCPTAEILDENCFTGLKGHENKFRCKNATPKYHNCMVISRLDTPLLADHLKTMSEWDAQSESPDVIARSPYDALDKQSLTCHMLARRKTIAFEKKLPEWLAAVKAEASQKNEYAADAFCKWIASASTARDFAQIKTQFDMMNGLLPNSKELSQLEAAVMVKKQYLSRWDYKASDKDVIDILMLDACTPNMPTVLIKLPASNAIDNIAAALLIDPAQIIYPKKDDNDVLRRFFIDRGDNIQPVFRSDDTPEQVIAEQLQRGVRVIIDATGARAEDISRAVNLALQDSRIALTACDIKSQRMLDMLNFPTASLIHSHNLALTAHEAFMLCGAGLSAGIEEVFSRHEMEETVPKLWTTFQTDDQDMRSKWKEAIGILQQHLTPRKKCFFKVNTCDIRNQEEKAVQVTHNFGTAYHTARLSEFFAQLKKHGVIIDFDTKKAPLVTLTYNSKLLFPKTNDEKIEEEMKKNFLEPLSAFAAPPRIIADENAKFLIPPESLTFTNVPTDHSSVKWLLNTLNDLLLLTVSYTDQSRATITFGNSVTRFACQQEGNLLELYCYYQILSQSTAADALISVPVNWTDDEENVTNEIDVIATNGFRCAVISCKDTKPDKTHIYEVISVANMLAGKHALPVFATAFRPAKTKERNCYLNVRNRARAMDVLFVGNGADEASVGGNSLEKLGALMTEVLG